MATFSHQAPFRAAGLCAEQHNGVRTAGFGCSLLKLVADCQLRGFGK
jgi:hypothetical protein